MRKFQLLVLAAGLLWTGCSKDVTLETRYVVRPLQQSASDDRNPAVVEGATAFAYAVDTAQWGVASYADAVAGVITNKETGERLTEPEAVSEPYVEQLPDTPSEASVATGGSTAGWLQLAIGHPMQMVVVVDPQSEMYAYTNQKLGENLHVLYTTVVFQPWKETSSYLASGWSFYREGYEPTHTLDCIVRPSAQLDEGGESQPVESMKIYAYAADTVEWGIASYDDAAAGVITRKKNSDRRTNPDFKAYADSQSGDYHMEVDRPKLMVVAVDRTHRIYAYTQQEVDLKGESPVFAPVFAVWKQMWKYGDAGWSFTNDNYSKEENNPQKQERE